MAKGKQQPGAKVHKIVATHGPTRTRGTGGSTACGLNYDDAGGLAVTHDDAAVTCRTCRRTWYLQPSKEV